MNGRERTWRASIWNCAVVGRGRIAGLESVLLALIWERVGVEAVSITLSPIQYRPCFLPPPTLITISPSISWELGSNCGPWTSLAIVVYWVTRLWMLGWLYASGGSSGLKSMSAVALPFLDRTHALSWEQDWPSCDDDYGKNAKWLEIM